MPNNNKNVKIKYLAFLGMPFLLLILLNMVPIYIFLLKSSGASFVITEEDYIVIYKGKTILNTPNNCSMISYTKDLSEIKFTCGSSTIIYKEGIKQ